MIDLTQPLLITGAEGFVGSHLVEYFQARGYTNLHGTAFRSIDGLKQKLGEDKAWQIDLENDEAVQEMVGKIKPAAIIHLAARPSVNESYDNAWLVLKTNAHLQLVMLEALRHQAPQARLLSIGSAQEYGMIAPEYLGKPLNEHTPFNPTNAYAVSKLTAEHLAQAYHLSYGLDVIHVRPFNQIGPGQLPEFAVPSFAQQIVRIERGEQTSLKVGNLSAIRDFTDVRDAASAYELLLQDGVSGEPYNLGSGQGVSMQAVLDGLLELTSAEVKVEVDPSRLRPADIPHFVADNSKIKELGWEPKNSLKQTLTDILAYERRLADQQSGQS